MFLANNELNYFFDILADCVGSAFNYISAMQCPNCRQLENGNWLFASGICSSVHEHMDDFVTPEEMYNMNYPDMVNFDAEMKNASFQFFFIQ